jgi:ribosomal-protein-alanine N-acetyltransferase
MKFEFYKMNNQYAHLILNWHYEKPFDFYDFSYDEDDYQEWMEKIKNNDWENEYIVFYNKEFIGFFIFILEENYLEIALGLHPDLTSQGIGQSFVEAGIEYAKSNFKFDFLILNVASFNIRAIKVYQRVGFIEEEHFVQKINNQDYDFIKMVRRK